MYNVCCVKTGVTFFLWVSSEVYQTLCACLAESYYKQVMDAATLHKLWYDSACCYSVIELISARFLAKPQRSSVAYNHLTQGPAVLDL